MYLHTTSSACECNGVVLLKSVIKLGERPSRGVCGVFRCFEGGRVVRKKSEKRRKYTRLYIHCMEWSQVSSGLVGTHLSLLFPSPVLDLVCDVGYAVQV